MKKALLILLLQLVYTCSIAQEDWTFIDNTTIDKVYAGGYVIKTRQPRYYVLDSKDESRKVPTSGAVKVFSNSDDYKLVFERGNSVFCTRVDRVIEDQISKEYKGPEGKTIYEFRDKGVWQQEGNYRVSYTSYSNSPLIMLFYFNGQWTMTISGTDETMTVKQLNSSLSHFSIFESSIDGSFEGWTGETIVKLTNGETWKQDGYSGAYGRSYHPQVTVYETDNDGYMMVVEGVSGQTRVKRIK